MAKIEEWYSTQKDVRGLSPVMPVTGINHVTTPYGIINLFVDDTVEYIKLDYQV